MKSHHHTPSAPLLLDLHTSDRGPIYTHSHKHIQTHLYIHVCSNTHRSCFNTYTKTHTHFVALHLLKPLFVSLPLSLLSSSHLSPLPPLSALAPLVESVAMVTAGRSQIGCIRLFPLTLVLLLKLPISLTDLLERRRRLCEYILINKNGRALRRERKGENIGRKYDVSK